MTSETNIFNCLLEANDIFYLYTKIGDILKNEIDITNEGFSRKPLANTIELLTQLQIIQVLDGEYIKIEIYSSFDLFFQNLMERIKETYHDTISSIVNCNKHYDEKRNQFYININEIPLKYMGLAMLMEQTGEFERINNRDYFLNFEKYKKIIDSKKTLLSLKELQKIIQHNAELGDFAEQFVLNYEKNKLKKAGISKQPQRISDIDVSAGYDIISYMDDSNNPNKFIEVKSCDNTLQFHISRNEIEKSKEKRNAYFLYLFNRVSQEVIEIQDPYVNIFQNNNEWVYESESYVVTPTNRFL